MGDATGGKAESWSSPHVSPKISVAKQEKGNPGQTPVGPGPMSNPKAFATATGPPGTFKPVGCGGTREGGQPGRCSQDMVRVMAMAGNDCGREDADAPTSRTMCGSRSHAGGKKCRAKNRSLQIQSGTKTQNGIGTFKKCVTTIDATLPKKVQFVLCLSSHVLDQLPTDLLQTSTPALQQVILIACTAFPAASHIAPWPR